MDLVTFKWFVRREDAAPDVAGVTFDVVSRWLPEALPADRSRDGFVSAWGRATSRFSWDGTSPAVGGSVAGLGADAPAAPVGQVEISFDRAAFVEPGRRDAARQLFGEVATSLPAFFAHAEVEQGVEADGGGASYGPGTMVAPTLVVRGRWLGLPCFDVWLAWFGPLYATTVRPHLPPGVVEEEGDALLVRTADAPPSAAGTEACLERPPHHRQLGLPQEMLVVTTGDPLRGGVSQRAALVPEGL